MFQMTLKSNNPLHAEINRNFLIRWKEQDVRYTYLTTARKYKNIVGEKLSKKHFDKVLSGTKEKYIFKLRGNSLRDNLEIIFVAK